MNITLSADEKLIRKAREYARKHGTTPSTTVALLLGRVLGNGNGGRWLDAGGATETRPTPVRYHSIVAGRSPKAADVLPLLSAGPEDR